MKSIARMAKVGRSTDDIIHQDGFIQTESGRVNSWLIDHASYLFLCISGLRFGHAVISV